FENSPIGIYRSNSKGEILVANQALAEIMGCNDVKKIKIIFSDLARDLYYEPKRRKEFLEIIAENDKVENFVFRAVTKKGKVVFLKLSGHISKRYEDYFEIDGFIEEITEKYKMEKKLAQSEEKFRSAFMNHSSPMLIIEPQKMDIVEVNQAALDYYGYNYQEFLEMKVTDLNLLSESEVMKEIEKAKSAQKNIFNFKHLLKNGLIKNVEVHSGSIKIKEKKYLFSIIHDITERKKIEAQVAEKRQELEAAEKMMNDILDLSTEAIRYVDLNYEIIKSNKRYRELNKLYQLDRKNKFSNLDKIDGSLNCFDTFCTGNCDTKNCSLNLIMQGREFIQEDVEIYLKGEKHYFIVTIVPYRNFKGKLIGIIQSYRDITARKKDENNLKIYNQKIKKLYSELDKEFEKGRILHQQFLPKKLPSLDKLDYQVYFQPASRLGGDFYNVIDIGDQLLIYLADVSGHGLDGSILNIFLREVVNNYISMEENLRGGLKTSDLLDFIINKYHKENIAVDYMTCLLLGVYNKKEKTFAFSNAGIHIPPLHIDASGKLNRIENGGVPISTAIALSSYQDSSIIDYREEKINLKAGDLLFITTDGIIEESVPNNKQKSQYGLKRLSRLLKNNHQLSAAEIIKNINHDFEVYSNSNIGQDDITFLIFKQK
ncbi:MAG: PAS domain S-box protein, partial [bacterium]